jgi:hypothetical protein
VDAGFNVHLTIDPDAQRVVQQTSRCYRATQASCQQARLAGDKQFSDSPTHVREGGGAHGGGRAHRRRSGRIEALGSAHTDCFRRNTTARAQGARLPDLPTAPRYEPDRLLTTRSIPTRCRARSSSRSWPRVPARPGYRKKMLADRVARTSCACRTS